MTPAEEKSLQTFSASVRQLILQYKLLQEKCADLQKMLSEKDDEIAALQQSLSAAQQTYSNLKMARLMEVGDDDVRSAKQRISKLVKEVDKCIALLNV